MRLGTVGLVLLCAACGSSDESPADCDPGESRVDGECIPDAAPCPEPGINLLDGSCLPVGVPSDACAEGFEWLDGACEPVLPAEPCAPGMMAIPGETSCRPVMECPTEPWGGIDGEATPQWVDGSYAGGDSDGSQARPWPTIGQAVAAAAPGSVIGIAAGAYAEGFGIQGKPLHLRGVCPAEVTIVGQSTTTPAVVVSGTGASGTSLTGLSMTGATFPFALSGATDVLIDRVRVHDTAPGGVDIEDPLGPTSAVIRDSLIEGVTGRGLLVLGATVSLERSVIRGTLAPASGVAYGAHAITSNYGAMARASLSVSRSVLTGNAGGGLFVSGSDAVVEGSVLSGNLPTAGSSSGFGIGAQVQQASAERSNVVVRSSTLSDNAVAGIFLLGATARIEATTVRGTVPSPNPMGGDALQSGRGINIQDDITDARAAVEVVGATVEGIQGPGVFVSGSDVLLEGVVVRDNAPVTVTPEVEWGRGINLQPSGLTSAQSVVTMRRSLVLRTQEIGLLVGDAILSLEESQIRDVAPADDELGFGDAISGLGLRAELSINRSLIEHSGRAAMSLFGSQATLTDSLLTCHPIDIALEDLNAGSAELTDGGGNQCGCDAELRDCKAARTDIQPPSPL